VEQEMIILMVEMVLIQSNYSTSSDAVSVDLGYRWYSSNYQCNARKVIPLVSIDKVIGSAMLIHSKQTIEQTALLMVELLIVNGGDTVDYTSLSVDDAV
jgi:uncharacterized membrane protein